VSLFQYCVFHNSHPTMHFVNKTATFSKIVLEINKGMRKGV